MSIRLTCGECGHVWCSEFDDGDCPNCNPPIVVTYIVHNKAYRGNHYYIVGACSTFKKAKELAFKGWNGEVKIIKSYEEDIDTVGLNFAYYVIDLVNVNGVSPYFIEIKKVVIDGLL